MIVIVVERPFSYRADVKRSLKKRLAVIFFGGGDLYRRISRSQLPPDVEQSGLGCWGGL